MCTELHWKALVLILLFLSLYCSLVLFILLILYWLYAFSTVSFLIHHLMMQEMHCPLCKGCSVSRTSALNSLQHFYTWLGSRKDIQPVRNLIQISQSVLLLRPGLTYSNSRKKAGRNKTHLYQTTSVFHQPHRLSSARWKVTTGESAVALCSWDVRAGIGHSTCGCMFGWQVRLSELLLTHAIHECLGAEFLSIRHYTNVCTCTSLYITTTNVLRPFFRDHLSESVPEENFWTLWCKGRLTEAGTSTIWLGASPSRLTSAHLHHPPIFFYRPDALPAAQPTASVHRRQILTLLYVSEC